MMISKALVAASMAALALPASATVLTIDTGWQADNLAQPGPTDLSSWTFTVVGGAHFSLTDCCIAGDTWTIVGDINGVSVVGPGANDKRADGTFFGIDWLDPTLGKFHKYIGAGDYTIRIVGDGLGGLPAGVGIRLDSTIPEPATWAMLILGFGLVGSALRRRNPVAA